MKIAYDASTDSLYITLMGIDDGEAAETREVAPSVMLDLDNEGRPLGIEILRACANGADLTSFLMEGILLDADAAKRLAAMAGTQKHLEAVPRRRLR